MTWTCPKCGKTLVTEEAYKRHVCNAYEEKYLKKCTRCGGTGKLTGLFGPTYECPNCRGTGRV